MKTTEDTLDKPTIGQLIEALQQFPLDTPIELLDADTGLRITCIHFGPQSSNGYHSIPNDRVYLWGEYGEMG